MDFPRFGKKLFYPSGYIDIIDHELTSEVDRELGYRAYYTQGGYVVYIYDGAPNFATCPSEEWHLVHSMEVAAALADHDFRVHNTPDEVAALNIEYNARAESWVYSRDTCMLYALDRQVTWELEDSLARIIKTVEPKLYAAWDAEGVTPYND